MSAAYFFVSGVTIVANVYAVVADFTKANFVLKTSDEVHVPRSWLPFLGALKAAGAAGLLLGLLGLHEVGLFAAAGLTVFFIGAVFAHVRARVFYNIAFPGMFLALAIASLLLTVAYYPKAD